MIKRESEAIIGNNDSFPTNRNSKLYKRTKFK